MTVADVTVVPVPTSRRADYLDFARRMAEVYRDHGATRVTDFWSTDAPGGQQEYHADGTDYADGQLRDLAAVVGASALESLVVTITQWPSREVRDRGNAAATSDPRVLATLDEEPVFEGRRLIAATFHVTMDLSE